MSFTYEISENDCRLKDSLSEFRTNSKYKSGMRCDYIPTITEPETPPDGYMLNTGYFSNGTVLHWYTASRRYSEGVFSLEIYDRFYQIIFNRPAEKAEFHESHYHILETVPSRLLFSTNSKNGFIGHFAITVMGEKQRFICTDCVAGPSSLEIDHELYIDTDSDMDEPDYTIICQEKCEFIPSKTSFRPCLFSIYRTWNISFAHGA